MEQLKSITKNGTFLSSLFGLYYLFVFTFKEGIPFPIDISILPGILIALGILSLLFTIVVVLYSTISVIVVTDPVEIDYEDMFFSRPTWIKSKSVAGLINYFFFFCVTPVLLFSLSIFDYEYVNGVVYLSLFLMPLLFVYYALTPNIRKDKLRALKYRRFWKAAVTFFYINVFALLSVFVYLKYLEFGLHLKTDLQYMAALLAFFVLSFFIVLPPRKKDSFQRNAEKFSNTSFTKEILKYPAFFVYAFSLILTLIPSIAYSTASVSFRFLNVGGGIERTYYFSTKSRVTIPPYLVEKCNAKGYCQTKKLNVLFDIGGTLYIKGAYIGGDSALISLPKQNLYMISMMDSKKNKSEHNKTSKADL